jgi:ribosomal protein S18 acetylase RimI-like enzyme
MMTDLPCKILDWDSEFFGFTIARVEGAGLTEESVERILNWSGENRISCLYFLCAPDDDRSVLLAEKNGFHLVDVRIELSWRAEKYSKATNTVARKFQKSDLPELQQIASGAFRATRFYFDSHFDEDRGSALYREWITKSCDGYADAVFVTQHQSAIGGFVTCHLDSPERGRIGLLGVSDEARGVGLGHGLVKTAQLYFANRGVKEVSVVTQARNLPAQRLYQANGFRTHSTHLWYHKWLS